VSSSGISLAICESAPRPRQITMPESHHSVFYRQMPFLPPNQQCQSTEGTDFFPLTKEFHGVVVQKVVHWINDLKLTGSIPRHAMLCSSPTITEPFTIVTLFTKQYKWLPAKATDALKLRRYLQVSQKVMAAYCGVNDCYPWAICLRNQRSALACKVLMTMGSP